MSYSLRYKYVYKNSNSQGEPMSLREFKEKMAELDAQRDAAHNAFKERMERARAKLDEAMDALERGDVEGSSRLLKEYDALCA